MGNRMRTRARARISVTILGNCLGDPVPHLLHRQQLLVCCLLKDLKPKEEDSSNSDLQDDKYFQDGPQHSDGGPKFELFYPPLQKLERPLSGISHHPQSENTKRSASRIPRAFLSLPDD